MANSSCLFLAVIFGILALSAANAAQEMHKLAIANNELALNLYRSFSNTGEGNVFFSPFSISSALAMLFYGTRGETAEELRAALGYNKANLKNEQVHSLFHHFLTKSLSDINLHAYVLKSENIVIADKAMYLVQDYRREIQRVYGATIQDVEFPKDKAKIEAKVTKWVLFNPNSRIEKLLAELERSPFLLFFNALHFKGKWKRPFSPALTFKQPFYNNGMESGAKDIQMMHITSSFSHANFSDFQALELPYRRDKISMLILLPNARDGLMTLEKGLSAEKMAAIQKKLSRKLAYVTIPKFKIEYDREVLSDLNSLGAARIFSPYSDFSGMTPDSVFAADMFHKATVEVNERGSEPTTVTSALRNRVRPVPKLKTLFIADHPFVFAIIDKRSDMILFLGFVNDL